MGPVVPTLEHLWETMSECEDACLLVRWLQIQGLEVLNEGRGTERRGSEEALQVPDLQEAFLN